MDGVSDAQAVEALKKIVFEGRLSSRSRVLDKVVDMRVLSTGEQREVALHPRLKEFPEQQLADPRSVASLERMKLILARAVKAIDAVPVNPVEVLQALDAMTELQVMEFVSEYIKLVNLEAEAVQARTLKNSSTTPSPGSSGQSSGQRPGS